MTSTSNQRSDEQWVADISASGERQEMALADLRKTLVAGLRHAFRNNKALPIEDLAQEALMRIISRLCTFRGSSRFTTWAMAVGVRITLSEMRRAHWQDISLEGMAEAGRLPARVSSAAEASAAYQQLLDVVHSAVLNELTERQRLAIQAELGGAPVDEIAQRLNLSRNALYELVYDARLRLKQAILRAGWSDEHVRSVVDGERKDA